MSDLRKHLDTGALLDAAYDLCGAPPSEAELIDWAERALAFARELDAGRAPARLRAVLEEVCALVEAHPASFAPAATWAEAKLDARPRHHALLLLDALASAPEREAMDAAGEPSASFERLFASLPPEKVRAADEAIRGARAWEAQVHELFRRAAERTEAVRFAARADSSFEEDYVLLARLEEGELLLTRNEAAVWVDWYGAGEPRLRIDGEELPPRPLPQGEGRRWPLPAKAPPFSLRLELGDLVHSVRIPADGS